MFEYQIVVLNNGAIVFSTEWHVGLDRARGIAWLLAARMGDAYEVTVRERREPFVSIPWDRFGMSASNSSEVAPAPSNERAA